MKCPECGHEMEEESSLNQDVDWLALHPESRLLNISYMCEQDRLRLEVIVPVMASRMQKLEEEPRLEWRMPT